MTKSEKSYFAPREIYAKDTEKTIERLRNARFAFFIITYLSQFRAKREYESWWKEGRGFNSNKDIIFYILSQKGINFQNP